MTEQFVLAGSLVLLAAAMVVLIVIFGRLRRRTHALRSAVRDAARARDQAQVLLAVAEAVNSSISLEDVLHVALSHCARLAGAKAGAIYLVRPGQVELTREAALGLAHHARGASRRSDTEPMLGAFLPGPPALQALDPEAAPGLEQGGHPSHVLVLPIKRAGQMEGAMELYLGPRGFPSQVTGLLQAVAAQAATAIRHAQLYREQEETSLTDDLTRLANRRYLAQRFLQEMQRARRHRKPMSVLMLDIDHFKAVNDSHGHLVGDAVLQQLGRILAEGVRQTDVCARYGGEEFAAILHETPLDGAMRLAGRLRAAVEAASFPAGLRLTVSVGVASTEDAELFPQLLELADEALYSAKESGRNRVHAAVLPVAEPAAQEAPEAEAQPAS